VLYTVVNLTVCCLLSPSVTLELSHIGNVTLTITSSKSTTRH